MPHCSGPAISAFCNLYKHNSRAASINALKANGIHNDIQNHYCRIIIIPHKLKYYIYINIYIYNARANKCHIYRIFECDILFLFYIFHGVGPYTYVIICNVLVLVLWYFTACLNLAFGESRFAVLSLQRRHMWVMGHKSESYQHHLLANTKKNIQTLSLET